MQPELSAGEWAVLGAVAEGPTHGFAVAQLLSPDGELGRIWTLPRPVVYQVVKKLLERDLIRARRTEASPKGPARTVLGISPAGRAALRRWLAEPVDHVRDVRSLLLLKLALLDRAGADPAHLLESQGERVRAQLDALAQARDEATGFDRVILEWRLAGSRATLDFLSVVAV
ncbi:MAG TPA: PadR family transcriptional regulator [Acidimicrobiales bacterium]|nr:PadR family transcriptional regulator [Acidimicrobiales bacterium]